MDALRGGRNERQVRRIQEAIEERLRLQGAKPARREGEHFGHWILLDYVDVVAHVFYQDARAFYDLEGLWADAPRTLVADAP